MILSGPTIAGAVHVGKIAIDPYDPGLINPASYDLTLGDELRVYVTSGADRSREGNVVRSWTELPLPPPCLDSKQPNSSYLARLSPEGFRVGSSADRPRVFLMHTRERICTHKYVPVIDGKSSLGRLGLVIHATAGYGDPGFDGQYTLEVVALGEGVILYPGMRIAQVRFHQLEQGAHSYGYEVHGHYVGEASMGPVASRSYKQFDRDPKTDPVPPPGHCRVCDKDLDYYGNICNECCRQPGFSNERCPVARRETGGAFYCSREPGHSGPCAAHPA